MGGLGVLRIGEQVEGRKWSAEKACGVLKEAGVEAVMDTRGMYLRARAVLRAWTRIGMHVAAEKNGDACAR